MLGLKCTRKPNVDVVKVFTELPGLFYNGRYYNRRNTDDRNIYSAGANKLSTNISNHLIMNLPKIINKLVYLEKTTKSQRFEILNNIKGWKSNRPLGEHAPILTTSHQTIIDESRRILELG